MKAMKCAECGGVMKTTRENFRHAALGLPGLILANVEVSRCPNCGEYEVAIPHLEGLMKAIAVVLVNKPSRLAPEEVGFLRRYLGVSGVDFAKRMGVTKEQASRWESGKKPLGTVADRLLRLMVVNTKPVESYSVDSLANIDDETTGPMALRMEQGRKDWQAAA